MPRHLFLRILGTEIDLETDYEEVIGAVHDFYECFLVDTPFKNPSETIKILSNGELTTTSSGNMLPLMDPGKTPAALSLSMLWQAAVSRVRDLDIFHAAAAQGDRSALMLGDPESGKTTLTLGLLREGQGQISLLAEEIAIVDLKGRRILPFPRAFTVTDQTLKLFPELASIPDRTYGKRTLKRIVSIREVLDAFSTDMGKPSTPSYILVLEPSEDFEGPATLENLRPITAIFELSKRSFSIHSGLVRSIDIARDLVSEAKCFRLKVGELGNTVKTVMNLVS